MATLETTTNPQFSQKVYSTLIKKKYKYESILLTYVPNMRTTAKFSAMSQAPYTCQISLRQNKA